MEEKRVDQEEMKHVCKLCSKRYPSGKSLGGHMRSHVIGNKNKPTIILPKKALTFHYHEEDDDEDEDGEITAAKHSGYGLRENPKKTWRLVGSTLKNKQLVHFHQPQQQQGLVEEGEERICKQCGKGFKSLKALCGHMSSHTERERGFKEEEEEEDYSWSSDSKEKLVLGVAAESHSDNNNSGKSKRGTRGSLSRYRSSNGGVVESVSVSPNGGRGGNGSSSNHSEIDQHEQEEVAMCLMMLSRDSSSVHFNFTTTTTTTANATAESSDDDNNSVILEGGSSSNYVGIKRKRFGLVNDNKVQVKGKVVADEMDNSDSGYFENGAKELESDGSVDANYGLFNKPKLEVGSRLLGGDSFNYGFESDENYSTKSRSCYANGNSNNVVSKKGSKYECGVCKKTFNTHQALGGHIISHTRKFNGDNNNTTLLETTTRKISPNKGLVASNSKAKTSKGKKVKGHMCPFCPKVFKSGQALGGHKRSHMMGSSSNYMGNLSIERAGLPPRHEPEQPRQSPPPLLDLNLPAPMDDEGSGSGNSQFVAW